MEEKGEIILYHPDEELKLEVRLEGETVWLNRQQLSILFDRDVKTIGKHVNNALKEELAGLATVAKFATVQNEGGRTVTRQVEYYNLDMILSVGYRVKSQRGIELRRWSNGVLKEYLLKGYAINQRIEHLENKMDSKFIVHDRQLKELASKVDFFVRTSLPPVEGVFFNGQIFDAYVFATNLIRSAKKSLLLIDNYIDESVLLMLAKRNSGASATIFTGRITAQLQLDLDKYNDQYPPINIRTYANAHDRFIIIDETEVYHIGASLKDLGKKLFAFTKMNMPASVIMNSLEL
ncbi:virulence RhuM family protein (plasmid) [Bacteroides fragilis]|nr:virulence RhuM family protein [Bacteroides fragilis]